MRSHAISINATRPHLLAIASTCFHPPPDPNEKCSFQLGPDAIPATASPSPTAAQWHYASPDSHPPSSSLPLPSSPHSSQKPGPAHQETVPSPSPSPSHPRPSPQKNHTSPHSQPLPPAQPHDSTSQPSASPPLHYAHDRPLAPGHYMRASIGAVSAAHSRHR